MSLLNTASPWTNSDTRKRTPAIGKRRTQKAPLRDEDNNNSGLSSYHPAFDNEITETLQSTVTLNEERGNTVNDMLNKITSSQVGEGLADFKPVQTLAKTVNEGFESPLLKIAAGVTEFGSSDIGSDNLSNYNKSYEASAILGKPYYSSSSKQSEGTNEIAKKLNYITHILEDVQMEKTSNITEELILYSFLGVFVIFIVDSFARVGKYHR